MNERAPQHNRGTDYALPRPACWYTSSLARAAYLYACSFVRAACYSSSQAAQLKNRSRPDDLRQTALFINGLLEVPGGHRIEHMGVPPLRNSRVGTDRLAVPEIQVAELDLKILVELQSSDKVEFVSDVTGRCHQVP